MWIWLIFLWIVIIPNAFSANPYQLGEVDYFHSFQDRQEDEELLDWREFPLTSEDRSSYEPPRVVLTLLEKPTLENARAYLAWQRKKIKKIIKAQEAIDQVAGEERDQ
jgi:hypothetical protein